MGKCEDKAELLQRENNRLKEDLEKLKHLERLTWQREDFENKAEHSQGTEKQSYLDALKSARETEKKYRNALIKERLID
jgi:hypothetical protein